MRLTILLGAVLLLAACGVDGPPVPPSEADEAGPAIGISGSVGVGIQG